MDISIGITGSLSIGFVCGFLGGWIVKCYGEKFGLVSVPNHRSSHSKITPHGGGIGIVLAGTIAGWMAYTKGHDSAKAIILSSSILALIGLMDDRYKLNVLVRIMCQFLSVIIVLLVFQDAWMSGKNIEAYYNYIVLSCWIVGGLWWINVYNFMDGIDTIAGLETIYILLSAVLLGYNGNWVVWDWMLTLAAAAGGFLLLNLPPAKVFMGDVGSTYLGFMIFVFMIETAAQNTLSIATWLILCAVFVSDATVTLLMRIISTESWFKAHRTHAYQILAHRWQNHGKVAILVTVINVAWLLPWAWVAEYNKRYWSVIAVALAYIPLILTVIFTRKRYIQTT